jgi:hypothetical protein
MLTTRNTCSLKSVSPHGEGEHLWTPKGGPNDREEVEF